MITVEHLEKRWGTRVAVDDLSFEVRPGVVTGFLGPNGAGKSTTMRLMLGLNRPTGGRVLIHGRRHEDLRFPLREVGALLDAKALHPKRRACDHLLALARSNGLAKARVDEVLGLTGLSDVATKRAGSFSLGMAQRLGIATALLGDPGVVLFDEPINGLDPDGILWIRTLLCQLAKEGRTVFVSSHVMSEMAQTASELVIIGKGKLLATTSVDELVTSRAGTLRVRCEKETQMKEVLERAGARVTLYDGALLVSGLRDEEVGLLARDNGVALRELALEKPSLEEVFMELTRDSVEYQGRAA